MTTKQFIEKHAQAMREGQSPRAKSCQSVLYASGTLYSYGSHYPLLWPITKPSGETLLVCNASGYSNTTRRHIAWCRDVADIFIKGHATTVEAVQIQLINEMNELAKATNDLKRKGTKREARMNADFRTKVRYAAALV